MFKVTIQVDVTMQDLINKAKLLNATASNANNSYNVNVANKIIPRTITGNENATSEQLEIIVTANELLALNTTSKVTKAKKVRAIIVAANTNCVATLVSIHNVTDIFTNNPYRYFTENVVRVANQLAVTVESVPVVTSNTTVDAFKNAVSNNVKKTSNK